MFPSHGVTEVVVIRAKVETTNADRTQWKVYNSTLSFPQGLYIRLEVPRELVASVNEDGSVDVTIGGWCYILETYTTALEQMNNRIRHQNR